MCGICGIVTFSGLPEPERARSCAEEMLQCLSHRGPDATSSVASETAVLGATRLAIRGLQDSAQPLLDAQTGLVTVCNGEIDNHHELRRWLAERGRPIGPERADVAVIPGLFLELGAAFASRLVGAFAVAIWDPRAGLLTLVRDRAGERPLFFASSGAGAIFATEIAALVACSQTPCEMDPGAIAKYLQLGIFPSPDTPFAGIQKVGPGEITQIDKQGVRRETYWRWSITRTAKQPPSMSEFDHIFRNAVARQSDVDVDFGLFLSGGLDSSLVSAVVRSLHPARTLKAYTLRFEEDSFDEGSFAELVARQFGMELTSLWVRPEDVQRELRTLVRLVGEPLADPAWVPLALLARRAAEDIPLALVGEGADELFGGYPTYIGATMAEKFARLPACARTAIRRALEALPPSEKKMTVSFMLKRFVQGSDLEGLTRHQFWVSNIPPPMLKRLGLSAVRLEERDASTGQLLDRVQQWDLETSLAEGLLTKADRASMSSALELRTPFLDEAVMEFAKSLPADERLLGFQTKVFLKRYALSYLPKQIVHRRKRGLSVPIARWLRGPLHEWASATLADGRLERVGIHTTAAMALFAEHVERKADHARTLWSLLVLCEWLDWVAQETQNRGKTSEHLHTR